SALPPPAPRYGRGVCGPRAPSTTAAQATEWWAAPPTGPDAAESTWSALRTPPAAPSRSSASAPARGSARAWRTPTQPSTSWRWAISPSHNKPAATRYRHDVPALAPAPRTAAVDRHRPGHRRRVHGHGCAQRRPVAHALRPVAGPTPRDRLSAAHRRRQHRARPVRMPGAALALPGRQTGLVHAPLQLRHPGLRGRPAP